MLIMCETCTLRHSCNFYKELEINLNNLTSQVSKESKKKIKDIIAEDITCSEYVKEES